jgi:hypothetical protein
MGRETLRFIVVEIWAYWRKQRQERKYEADMAAFRAGEGNLRRLSATRPGNVDQRRTASFASGTNTLSTNHRH